jgi:beta-glucosidase/6-phospho-beta-glucosidase/beta-galactosidase
VRWGVPWYRVEPEEGRFDWSWTDRVIPYLVDKLGLTPIVDLIHYGCPLWLRREFANPDYPRAVASYAAAFARRYAGYVHWYTPVNEPLMTALMCGRRAVWPPYLRGDAGYIRVMLQVMRGALETVHAVRQVDPAALMVHVEAVSVHRAAASDLQALADEDQRRDYLSYDLLAGRVTPDHPVFPWLLRHGATPRELAEIARNRIALDVLGLNFYPQWSTREYYLKRSGRLANRAAQRDGAGFEALIAGYASRYDAPVMITETSAAGSEEERARWLAASVAAVKRLRERGVLVYGYTWFPLFTMYDWRYRFGTAPKERYRVDLGLFTLDGAARRWRATPLADRFRAYTADPPTSIGDVGGSRAESAV